jgi:hypothetical protein
MSFTSFLFRTSRFNLSKVGAHFINPCCFGEDLAAWLAEKLTERGIEAGQPYQEDWGWEFRATTSTGSIYYFGMGGIPDETCPGENSGEWRVFIEKKRSLWQLLTGSGKISVHDPMLTIVEEVLKSQPDFEDIRSEV